MPRSIPPKDYILNLFLEDHDRMRRFLEDLSGTLQAGCSGDEAARLLTELRRTAYHETLEEDVLFPFLRARGLQEHPNLFVAEHGLLRNLRSRVQADLDRMAGGLEFQDRSEPLVRAQAFVDRYLEHLDEEEATIYPAALALQDEPEAWEKLRRERGLRFAPPTWSW